MSLELVNDAPVVAPRRLRIAIGIRPDLVGAAGAFGLVGGLAAANGGYFAPAWGSSAVALLWLTATGLVLGVGRRPGRLGWTFLAALAGLVGLAAVSSLWSNPTQAVPEAQRGLVYVSGAAAVVLLLRRELIAAVLGGMLAAIVVVAAYAMATRLFPDRLGVHDPVARYRLAYPLGYWNGLGALCALGAVLALAFAARAATRRGRALAAASLVVLLPALYFTFGRTAWIALAAGLAVAIALDARRGQLLAATLAAAAAPALAVWLGSRSDALTRRNAVLANAAHDGHRLALILVALAALAAALSLALSALIARVHPRPRARVQVTTCYLLAALLLSGVAAGAVGMFGRLGDPVSAVRDAKRAFAAPAPQIGTDLNKRLFTLSGTGRAQLWRAAWDDARAHPWLGSGAGSFEGYWLAHRPTGLKVRDAHSLYLETLAELGPGGLALLVLALGLPLVAAVRARREPLVPIVAGAYVVYLVHAAADWDWELAGVTLPALACGAVLLVAVGGKPRRLGLRAGVLAAATSSVLLMAALAGLAGSNALAASAAAAREGRWGAAAAQAGLARRWAPWSAEPWRRLGEAELARGRRAVARHDFARALAKDPHDAATWLDLAGASNGRAARRALAHVRRLDPRSPDLADFRRQFRQTDPKGATR